MSKMVIVEGNSNDKDNVRTIMVKGEKGEQGDVSLPQLNAEISARTNADNNLRSQISALASGSPLVASSVSEMTNTSKTYVNTTDGKWYYYNGTSWIAGGIYQTTGIDLNGVGFYELNEELKKQLSLEHTLDYDYEIAHYRITDNQVVKNTSVQTYRCTVIDVVAGDTYYISAAESSANTYGYIFADDNGNVISYGMQGTGTRDLFEEIVKVPNGATKMYHSYYYTEYYLRKMSIIVKILSKDFNQKLELFNMLGNFENVTLPSETDGKCYGIKNNTLYEITAGGYKSSIFSVNSGEVYNIKALEHSSKTYGYIFTDDNENIISYGMQGLKDFQYIYLEDTVKVPNGATKMYCSWNYSGSSGSEYPFKILKGKKVIIDGTLEGKNITVIGDSISTKINKNAYEIVIGEEDVGVELSAYLTYYDVQNSLSLGGHTFTSNEIGTEVTFTPTSDDIGKGIGLANNYNTENTKTWWELLEQNYNCKVNPVCWSGASITSHEGTAESYKTSYSWHDAQIRKAGLRVAGSMLRNSPDIIIIYRGTNDFSHTSYAKLTKNTFDDYNFEVPITDVVNTNDYGFKEGLVILVSKLRNAYPKAKIYICTLNVFKRVNYSHYPTNNGVNSLPQYNNAIREVCDFMGCNCIELDKDGITFENCYSEGYITDSATTPTHPSSKGHEMIYKQVIKDI